MIQIKELKKCYKENFWSEPFWAVNGVSCTVKEDKITGLLGVNGAGKTTLFKSIMGFERPNSGKIIFSESLGHTRKEVLRKVGYLPERPYFYSNTTGNEILYYLGTLLNIRKSELKKNIDYWASRLKIDHALNKKTKEYSKGMLQRLGLVSVLIHNPRLIILDEPMSGLDPIGRKEIKEVLKELYKQGKTVFFSSHITVDIEDICQEVVVLNRGELSYSGSIAEIFKQKNIQYRLQVKDLKPGLVSRWEEQNGIYEINIDESEVDKTIEDILNGGGHIVDLRKKEDSLEEIIYHTNK